MAKGYSYWDDLRTDLRKPSSKLDVLNMVLRRFGLILVKHVDEDRDCSYFRLRWWPRAYQDFVNGGEDG